mgnify:CR=1 FL=1
MSPKNTELRNGFIKKSTVKHIAALAGIKRLSLVTERKMTKGTVGMQTQKTKKKDGRVVVKELATNDASTYDFLVEKVNGMVDRWMGEAVAFAQAGGRKTVSCTHMKHAVERPKSESFFGACASMA